MEKKINVYYIKTNLLIIYIYIYIYLLYFIYNYMYYLNISMNFQHSVAKKYNISEEPPEDLKDLIEEKSKKRVNIYIYINYYYCFNIS